MVNNREKLTQILKVNGKVRCYDEFRDVGGILKKKRGKFVIKGWEGESYPIYEGITIITEGGAKREYYSLE